MKSFLLILLCLCLLTFSAFCPARVPRGTTLTVYRSALLKLMMKELEPPRVRATYRSAFKVQQVSKNRYEPAIKDTLLAVSTAADQVLLFANKYNTFLIKAALMSNKVTFGRNIRVAARKEAFCRAYQLSAAYDQYRVTDDENTGTYLEFSFSGGTLRKVCYQIGYME